MATKNVAEMKANRYYVHSMHVRQMEARFRLATTCTNATISCKILVKIGPVVSAENILIEIALRFHLVVWRISSNISGRTRPIFAIFSPYESALRAEDGSCLLYTSPSPRDRQKSRMPSSA